MKVEVTVKYTFDNVTATTWNIDAYPESVQALSLGSKEQIEAMVREDVENGGEPVGTYADSEELVKVEAFPS
jgi:predicted lactoylglutathione lyase